MFLHDAYSLFLLCGSVVLLNAWDDNVASFYCCIFTLWLDIESIYFIHFYAIREQPIYHISRMALYIGRYGSIILGTWFQINLLSIFFFCHNSSDFTGKIAVHFFFKSCYHTKNKCFWDSYELKNLLATLYTVKQGCKFHY